jgi:hypothetical protein
MGMFDIDALGFREEEIPGRWGNGFPPAKPAHGLESVPVPDVDIVAERRDWWFRAR